MPDGTGFTHNVYDQANGARFLTGIALGHGSAAEVLRRTSAERARKTAILAASRDMGPVVYMVRIGGLVKIGTSRNLAGRLRQLKVPFTDVLCVEPGDQAHEHALHHRFRKAHVSGEMFRLTDDLQAYINERRAALLGG